MLGYGYEGRRMGPACGNALPVAAGEVVWEWPGTNFPGGGQSRVAKRFAGQSGSPAARNGVPGCACEKNDAFNRLEMNPERGCRAPL